MSRILQTYDGEGFEATAVQDDDGRVVIEAADADIDADGANGQNGAKAAYRSDDKGSEALSNGGMGLRGGKVVFAKSWGPDIVLTRAGAPLVLSNGVIPSKTAYRLPGLEEGNPAAYIDAETVPYIVVSTVLRNRAEGVVLGCLARATNLRTGKVVTGGVFDLGTRTKVGELSIEMARQLGIPDSPRFGGENDAVIKYEFWPGTPAEIKGVRYRLLRANGTHV